MEKFPGFTDQETFTRLPDTFFRQLLKEIDDADELKVTLHALWRTGNMETGVHVLREEDFGVVVPDPGKGLEKAVRRGTLLRVRAESADYYFLNSPRGRLAAESLRAGRLSPASLPPSAPLAERPNVFKLYEENIGPLTPLIADALKDAEQDYPAAWIEEALGEAIKRNKRSWKYVETILRRWKEEGHAEEQDRRDAKELRGKDVTRKVEDFLKR